MEGGRRKEGEGGKKEGRRKMEGGRRADEGGWRKEGRRKTEVTVPAAVAVAVLVLGFPDFSAKMSRGVPGKTSRRSLVKSLIINVAH